MNPALLYLVKVVLCSGILVGYYCLSLRNKVFHQWNRFYLLTCVMLSLLVPLLKIHVNYFYTPQHNQVLQILHFVNTGDDVQVESSSRNTIALSAEQWLILAYSFVALTLCCIMVANGFRIYSILRSYPKKKLNHIYFLNTNAKGTPFSFFKYIIWNRTLDLNTESGQRIFQHELVHVEQRHTWDKVFLLLVLIPFWANPFFWLIRKELTALHEFAADQKAMQSGDAAALAQLILHTMFPEQHFFFTNHFFQSTIKRRLAMFTKLQNPNVSFWSRIAALPVLLIVIASFALKTKAPHQTASYLNPNTIHAYPDTFSQRIYKDKPLADVQYFEWPKKEVHLFFSDGTKDTISYAEAKAANLFDTAAISRIERRPWAIEKVATPNLAEGDFTLRKASKEEARRFKGMIMLDNKRFNGTFQQLPIPENEIAYISFIKGNAFDDVLGIKLLPSDSLLAISTKAYMEQNRRTDNEPLFTQPEIEPKFPDANGGWKAFLQKNLNAAVPVKNGAKPGTYKVTVGFIVDTDGKLYDIKPLTHLGYGIEDEVVRLMKLSPDWIPAMQNGNKVSAYKKQTVTFVIAEG